MRQGYSKLMQFFALVAIAANRKASVLALNDNRKASVLALNDTGYCYKQRDDEPPSGDDVMDASLFMINMPGAQSLTATLAFEVGEGPHYPGNTTMGVFDKHSCPVNVSAFSCYFGGSSSASRPPCSVTDFWRDSYHNVEICLGKYNGSLSIVSNTTERSVIDHQISLYNQINNHEPTQYCRMFMLRVIPSVDKELSAKTAQLVSDCLTGVFASEYGCGCVTLPRYALFIPIFMLSIAVSIGTQLIDAACILIKSPCEEGSCNIDQYTKDSIFAKRMLLCMFIRFIVWPVESAVFWYLTILNLNLGFHKLFRLGDNSIQRGHGENSPSIKILGDLEISYMVIPAVLIDVLANYAAILDPKSSKRGLNWVRVVLRTIGIIRDLVLEGVEFFVLFGLSYRELVARHPGIWSESDCGFILYDIASI